MKLNKRIKNTITNIFIFNILIMSGFILLIIYIILPSFNNLEEKKEELQKTLISKKKIQKTGINFTTFKSFFSKDSEKNNYENYIFKKIKKDFYDNNFINKDKESFDLFISEKEKTINEKKSSKKFKENIEKIKKILPTYTDLPTLESELNNPKFINYLESLLYTFNLESNISSIGISKVLPVDNKDKDKDKIKETIKSNIFYIPFNFNIIGQKKDILDFLHYITNVGTLDIIDDDIYIYSDNKIRRTLEGEKRTKDYNIYENQIMDILSIKMSDYPDSSIGTDSNNEELDLYTLIKKEQGREKFEVSLELVFYIKGIPNYKIKELIDNIKEINDNLLIDISEIKKELKNKINSSKTAIYMKNIDIIKDTLDLMTKDLLSLEKRLSKKDLNKEKLYTDIMDYYNRLNNIKAILLLESNKLGLKNEQ